ncbi:hypothetical protein [Lederbergia galactosidilytica]|uniref:hypothetical protein n=1 Tax=Lederbergia galactosidilytica TaxID=217031 RepID=UPI001EE5247A|nr:hypothetical protein [Lederbergia galactosidilytica]
MISIFIPEGYAEFLDKGVYPNRLIKVIEHPISMESVKDLFTHPGYQACNFGWGDMQ